MRIFPYDNPDRVANPVRVREKYYTKKYIILKDKVLMASLNGYKKVNFSTY